MGLILLLSSVCPRPLLVNFVSKYQEKSDEYYLREVKYQEKGGNLQENCKNGSFSVPGGVTVVLFRLLWFLPTIPLSGRGITPPPLPVKGVKQILAMPLKG